MKGDKDWSAWFDSVEKLVAGVVAANDVFEAKEGFSRVMGRECFQTGLAYVVLGRIEDRGEDLSEELDAVEDDESLNRFLGKFSGGEIAKAMKDAVEDVVRSYFEVKKIELDETQRNQISEAISSWKGVGNG